MTIRPMLALAAMLIGGCANFQAVSNFSHRTTDMTGVARAEFDNLGGICREQAELTIVVNNIQNDGPLGDCNTFKASQGKLASVTLDVLDAYAAALTALADDKSFDVSSDIEGLGSKIQGLTDSSGKAIVDRAEVGALTKLVSIIADVATQARRKQAVEQLVAEKDDLAVAGRLLRSFFVRDPSAPPGRAQAPYANIIALTSDSLISTDATLGHPQFQKAEPIRSAELLRASASRRNLIKARQGDPAGKVPIAVAAAIDAWLASLDTFAADAFRPDSAQLLALLSDVKAKALTAKSALATLTN